MTREITITEQKGEKDFITPKPKFWTAVFAIAISQLLSWTLCVYSDHTMILCSCTALESMQSPKSGHTCTIAWPHCKTKIMFAFACVFAKWIQCNYERFQITCRPTIIKCDPTTITWFLLRCSYLELMGIKSPRAPVQSLRHKVSPSRAHRSTVMKRSI